MPSAMESKLPLQSLEGSRDENCLRMGTMLAATPSQSAHQLVERKMFLEALTGGLVPEYYRFFVDSDSDSHYFSVLLLRRRVCPGACPRVSGPPEVSALLDGGQYEAQ